MQLVREKRTGALHFRVLREKAWGSRLLSPRKRKSGVLDSRVLGEEASRGLDSGVLGGVGLGWRPEKGRRNPGRAPGLVGSRTGLGSGLVWLESVGNKWTELGLFL